MNGVAILYRNSLEFVVPNEPVVVFNFPASAASDMEIKDKWEYKKSLIKFLIDSKIKGNNWLLVLSPELIFEREIKAIGQSEIDKAVKEYIDELPFPPENIDHRLLMKEGHMYIQASNRDLFQTTANTFRSTGSKVLGILTMSILKVDKITSENVQEVLSKFKSIDPLDLTKDKPELNWLQRIFFRST